MAGQGHNSVAADELRSLVERIEAREEDKKEIAEDIGDIYRDGKSRGYDPKLIRKIVAMRKIEAKQRDEEQAVLETYMHALGMI